MFFKLHNAKKVEREGFTAYLYNEKKNIPEFNGVYVEVNGAHDTERMLKSHRLYYVISGIGKFMVNGEEKEVGATDFIVIPPQSTYNYKGKMILFEVNFPATDSNDVEKIKD